MSELHRKFIKKIKDREKQVGLPTLEENSHKINLDDNNDDDHNEIIKYEYEKIRNHTKATKAFIFPIEETYTDSKSGMSFKTYYSPPISPGGAVLVCHHGAGSSAMTFCKLAKEISDRSSKKIGLFTFDARGHGDSSMTNPVDYTLKALTEDFKFILETFYEKQVQRPLIYLVGHSLGGSVVTNYLVECPDTSCDVVGLISLDIVEETAIDALSHMLSFVRMRPHNFASYNDAIKWSLKRTSLLYNEDSARISIPHLLRETPEGLVWKTDLKPMAPFWDEWFKGFSTNFVNCGKRGCISKLLVLSKHESLDTPLIVGQMQGKYQLIVFNQNHVGHFVQEDVPAQLSISFTDFVEKNNSPQEYIKNTLKITPKWGGPLYK